MRRTVTGALLLALLGAAACSGDSDGAGPSPSLPTRTTITAQGGGPVTAGPGDLRVGVPEEPASLNPFDRRSRTQAGLAVLGVVLPQLFRVAPAGTVEGWLAEGESVAETAGGATFSLRRGARWSDGTPITAADVRFTWETVRGEAWPGPKAGYDRVTAVEGDGAEVRLTFDGPFPGWRRLFSGADFLLPAHRLRGKDLKAEWAAGPDLAGGPFRLGPVTRGLEVVLDRNEGWWGGAVGAARLRVTVVPDSRTLEQLLERKELDVAWPPAEANRQGRYRRLPGVEVDVAPPGGRVEMLVANAAKLTAPRRAALLGLLPRDRFVEVLLGPAEAQRAVSLAGPTGALPAPAWEAWAATTGTPGGPALAKGSEATLVGDEEDPAGPLLGRVLEAAAYDRSATVELKFADSVRVEGDWLPAGRFDLALVEDVAWPDPCWRCWFDEPPAPALAREPGLGALAAAADRGEPGSAGALEAAVRARSVVLPLWRPAAVLAGRDTSGLEANAWSVGPFWRVERWKAEAGVARDRPRGIPPG